MSKMHYFSNKFSKIDVLRLFAPSAL